MRLLLVLATTITLALSTCEPARAGALIDPRTPHGPCVPKVWPKPRMSRPRITQLAKAEENCVARRFGVRSSWMVCTAYKESRHYPWNVNAEGASGLYQHLRSLWAGRVRAYLEHSWFPHNWPPNPFNERANAIITARMVRRGGTDPWGGGCG